MSQQFSQQSSDAAEQSSLMHTLRYLSPSSVLVGGLVGLVIGLIVAWVIWPVQWTNAWPSDLAPEAKAQYLAAVAQVYATDPSDGAVDAAQAKLYDLNDNLDEEIASAQAYFDESLQRDARIQINALAQMAAGMGVTSEGIITLTDLEPAVVPDEGAAPTSSGGSSWLRWIFSLLMVVVLIGGGIWIISKLARHEPDDESSVNDATPSLEEATEGQSSSSRLGPASGGRYAIPPADEYQFETEPDDEALLSASASLPTVDPFTDESSDAYFDESTATSPPKSVNSDAGEPHQPLASATPAVPAATTAAPSPVVAPIELPGIGHAGRVLNTYLVQYQAGVVDYDQSHNIIDPSTNQYIGECGMGVNVKNGILHDIAENVIALDVWLFDQKQDKSLGNQTRVLLSEYAIDRGLEQSFVREQPDAPTPVVAQPGISFQLKGRNLILDCEILEAEYTSTGSETGIFKNVKVEMTVRVRG